MYIADKMQISYINGTKKAFAALTSVTLLLFLVWPNRQPSQNVFE